MVPDLPSYRYHKIIKTRGPATNNANRFIWLILHFNLFYSTLYPNSLATSDAKVASAISSNAIFRPANRPAACIDLTIFSIPVRVGTRWRRTTVLTARSFSPPHGDPYVAVRQKAQWLPLRTLRTPALPA